MKRQWHIRTRILITLLGLTGGILLAVGLVFNLSVRAYLQNRVSTQLIHVREDAVSDRREPPPEREMRPEGRPDRVTGAVGNAVILDQTGHLVSPFRGDREVADALSAWFTAHGISPTSRYRTLTLDFGKYAVTVSPDPMKPDCYLVSYVDVTAILALSTRINTVLLIIILAALILSIFLSRRFARSLAQPVQELSDFAGRIGGGDFAPRDLHYRDTEFEELAGSMNRMAAELAASRKKQETFFQNVSHELRTPLTAIRGNAEGIVCGVMEPLPAARVILRESENLGGLVEDILYLSRRGKGKPEGEAEPVDLRDILSLCVSEQRTEAGRKGIGFDFDFAEDPVLYPIREKEAQQLFGNLISNAIRYAGGTVKIVCREDADTVTVRVADDGDGIPEKDLPHIFERFYKGPGGKHGIGLSIAHSVATDHHATLTAHNDGGAVFEVRFPR